MTRTIYRVEVRGEHREIPAWRLWYSTRHRHIAESTLERIRLAIGVEYLARITSYQREDP